MPMHDWERVEAGIYHDFHHEWISTLKHALNRGLLPPDHYALAEQIAAGFGPDVLTLHDDLADSEVGTAGGGAAVLTQAKPAATHIGRIIGGVSPRRKSRVAVRHVTGDRVVAIIEILSPGNKSAAAAFRSLVEKTGELLAQRVHLLLIDPFPPGPRDPNGIHGAIWESLGGGAFSLPTDRPLTLASYEVGADINAYVETLSVGEPLPDMPLFLAPDMHVRVPLEKTYQAAWETVPPRWQRVIAPPGHPSP